MYISKISAVKLDVFDTFGRRSQDLRCHDSCWPHISYVTRTHHPPLLRCHRRSNPNVTHRVDSTNPRMFLQIPKMGYQAFHTKSQ